MKRLIIAAAGLALVGGIIVWRHRRQPVREVVGECGYSER
jgi:hypothetical protein